MSDSTLRPATREDIVFALSYGLRYTTVGRPPRHGSELAATVAAELLVEAHLRCEETEGAARAVRIAERGEAWVWIGVEV